MLSDFLKSIGLDPGAILKNFAPLPGRDELYPAHQWRSLLEYAADRTMDPLLGLRVGAGITPAHLGILGYVLQASDSAAAALTRYCQYQRLVHDVSEVTTSVRGNSVCLEWNEQSREVGLLVNQCGMSALLHFGWHISSKEALRPQAVHFVEAAPADAAAYAALLGCPVLFGQNATRIVLPAAFLDLPLRSPDAALVDMLEDQLDALLQALPGSGGFELEVRRQLCRHILKGNPALELVARGMHLSGRTLRRRLHEQGWAFQRLLDDTRMRLALNYLDDTRLHLAEVALLLGYAEQSAFNRAFVRWAGMPPRRWRLSAQANKP